MALWYELKDGELVETDDDGNTVNYVLTGYCFKCKQSYYGEHECKEK